MKTVRRSRKNVLCRIMRSPFGLIFRRAMVKLMQIGFSVHGIRPFRSMLVRPGWPLPYCNINFFNELCCDSLDYSSVCNLSPSIKIVCAFSHNIFEENIQHFKNCWFLNHDTVTTLGDVSFYLKFDKSVLCFFFQLKTN